MSRALGAAFLHRQVEQLEKTTLSNGRQVIGGKGRVLQMDLLVLEGVAQFPLAP
jgi:hypothetical protein